MMLKMVNQILKLMHIVKYNINHHGHKFYYHCCALILLAMAENKILLEISISKTKIKITAPLLQKENKNNTILNNLLAIERVLIRSMSVLCF